MRGSCYTRALLVLTLVGLFICPFSANGALIFRSPITNDTLPSNITVGNASDVVIEIQCISNDSSSRPVSWNYNQSSMPVPEPLSAFGVSQNSGVLRIYPVDLIQDGGVFICGQQLVLRLSLADSLFFSQSLPSQLTSSSNFTCPPVPLIPAATIVSPLRNTTNTTTLLSCRVDTDRGSFSSRQVPIFNPVEPEFVINPLNTTAPMFSETAFSCSVRPVDSTPSLVAINWYFEPEPISAGSGYPDMTLMPNSLMRLTSSQNVTVVDSLVHRGTSILRLQNVTMDSRGFYFCQAEFNDGLVSNSSQGFLEITVEAMSVSIILPPPLSLTVQEGTNVTLPCVTARTMPPTWTLGNDQLMDSDENSLSIVNVNRTAAGVYMCKADNQSSNVTLNVEFPLLFTVTPPSELTVYAGEPINLTCQATGNPLPGRTRWLRDASEIISETNILYIPSADQSHSGVYQCVIEATPPSLTNIVAHTYIRVVELGEAVISPPPNITLFLPDTPPNITLTCNITDTPLVRISWTNDTGTTLPSSLQLPRGFREPSSSQLVLTTSQLVAENTVTCSAELMGRRTNDTAIVRVFARAEVLQNPNPSALLQVVGDEIIISCITRGLPSPNVTWISSDNQRLPSTVTTQLVQFPPRIQSNLSITIDSSFANNTEYRCVAENNILGFQFNSTSAPVNVTIAGPPLSPVVDRLTPLSRSVTVQIIPPFSLLIITNYSISITKVGETVPIVQNSTTLPFTVDGLSPFTNYTLAVVAINRAGASGASNTHSFRTREDVPEDVPMITTITATVLRQLTITWSHPPVSNGIIIEYIIRYTRMGRDSTATRTTGNTATTFILNLLEPGVNYSIAVAARNSAGIGNFSQPTEAQTIAEPPLFPNNNQPTVSQQVTPTTTTVPIEIPDNLFGSGSVRQYWVVVIRLNEASKIASFRPDNLYPNSTALMLMSINTTSVTPIRPGSPYIAAEITNLTLPRTFLLGDSLATDSLNDNLAFTNPPLEPNTNYAVFIRAFPPQPSSLNNNMVQRRSIVKRQSSSGRQLTVFSSTDFIMVSTASNGIGGGAIAGIIFCLLVVIAAVVIIAVVIFIFIGRPALKSQPPPSRRGSMRLTDSQRVTLVAAVRKNTELANLTPPDQREPIISTRFPEYVRSLHANSDHLFSEEFELLAIKSPSLVHNGSSMPYNVPKNRYGNINCYDETRVYLSLVGSVEGTDYINANFIDGYNQAKCYVACQGPLPSTMPDFWRMVWEQDSSCIVMLTNCVERGREKCYQYWPQTGSISMNDMTVTIVDTQVLAYYTIRTFQVNRGNDRREIKQFHYTAWPDFGVPDHPNPVISFIRRVNNFKRSTDGPDIVHCSAGVGRTGTYISIQTLMDMMTYDGKVDVFNFVLGMRKQRNFMVQTEQQYIFIHDALVETIKVSRTEISVTNFRKELAVLTIKDPETDICPLQRQFDRLNGLDFPNPSEFGTATLSINASKNRFPDILPYEAYRVKLHLQPGVLGSDYINASSVDGYLRCNQFIITQGPLKSTVDDFWRMVWEHRVSAIVMLCKLEEIGKEQSARYWPSDKIVQYGDMFVETINETDSKFYTIREFRLTHSKQSDTRLLKQFHYTEWSEDHPPSSSTSIINMISLVQKAHHQYGGGPVVVHDSSSIGRAGSFCATNIVLERLKVEGMIDVFFTIHSLRRKHPGIVATYDQYLFSFNTVVEFLDSFDQYANFD